MPIGAEDFRDPLEGISTELIEQHRNLSGVLAEALRVAVPFDHRNSPLWNSPHATYEDTQGAQVEAWLHQGLIHRADNSRATEYTLYGKLVESSATNDDLVKRRRALISCADGRIKFPEDMPMAFKEQVDYMQRCAETVDLITRSNPSVADPDAAYHAVAAHEINHQL